VRSGHSLDLALLDLALLDLALLDLALLDLALLDLALLDLALLDLGLPAGTRVTVAAGRQPSLTVFQVPDRALAHPPDSRVARRRRANRP